MNDLLVIICDKESDGIAAASKVRLLPLVDQLYLFVQDKIEVNELDWLDDESIGINIPYARTWCENIFELGIRAGIAYYDSDVVMVCDSSKMPSTDDFRRAQRGCAQTGEYSDAKITSIHRNKFVISVPKPAPKADNLTAEIGAATREQLSPLETVINAIDAIYGIPDIYFTKEPDDLKDEHTQITKVWQTKIKKTSKNRLLYAEHTTPKDLQKTLEEVGVGGLVIFVMPTNQEKLYESYKTLQRFNTKKLSILIFKGAKHE